MKRDIDILKEEITKKNLLLKKIKGSDSYRMDFIKSIEVVKSIESELDTLLYRYLHTSDWYQN